MRLRGFFIALIAASLALQPITAWGLTDFTGDTGDGGTVWNSGNKKVNITGEGVTVTVASGSTAGNTSNGGSYSSAVDIKVSLDDNITVDTITSNTVTVGQTEDGIRLANDNGDLIMGEVTTERGFTSGSNEIMTGGEIGDYVNQQIDNINSTMWEEFEKIAAVHEAQAEIDATQSQQIEDLYDKSNDLQDQIANSGWTVNAGDGYYEVSTTPNDSNNSISFVGDDNISVSLDNINGEITVSLNKNITVGFCDCRRCGWQRSRYHH